MNKNTFIFSILNDNSLTSKDREKVISLISRDMENELVERVSERLKVEIAALGKESSSEPVVNNGHASWIHSPRIVCDFLRKFSSDPIIRYVFHSWDKKEFKDYDDYIDKITGTLKNDRTFTDLYRYNIGLNYTLKRFILGKTEDFLIPRESIKIGLQYPIDVIRLWMEAHPERKMEEVPMTAFPKENRPKGLFHRNAIANMGQLIDYFKHLIEFRDSDFEDMVFDTFHNSDYEPKIDDSVKGISFYTYTSVVQSFLSMCQENIKQRIQDGASKDVHICVKNQSEDSFELRILHRESFASKGINDAKLRTGSLASWRRWQSGAGGNYNSLLSVCDYAVESRFLDEEKKLGSYRIDYLYPGMEGADADTIPPKVTRLGQEAEGFEYILKFYR